MSHDNLGFTASTDVLDLKGYRTNSKPIPNSYTEKSEPQTFYSLELEEKRKNEKEYEDNYDPFEHRVVAHPTTNMETLFHLLKGSLGTGILAMPMAFYNSGYVVGTISTVIIGALCTYCILILVKSEYELCKRKKVPSMTYPATIQNALQEGPQCLRRFSQSSIHITNTFLMIYQLGTCCVYIVFIAKNFTLAFKSFLPDEVNKVLTEQVYMTILMLPLIFVNWIKNLKFLAPCSKIATTITFISFGIILYYIFREPLSFDGCEPAGEIENFPLFFGTVLFALEAIGVIMPLENEMKHPKRFASPCGVLNIGMIMIIILYTGMGFFGYIRYGNAVMGSVTLNLPEEPLAKVVQILLAIAIFFTQPIQCYVAIDIVWNEYLSSRLEKNAHRKFWEYVVRTTLVVITTILAIVVKNLELFISLFGALCLSALGLAFPAIIQLCTFWKVSTRTQKGVLLVKNLTLLLIGFIGLVVGTYTSLREIIEKVFIKGS